jgi:hypothetical protein
MRVLEFDLTTNGGDVPFPRPLQLWARRLSILRDDRTSDQVRFLLSHVRPGNLPIRCGGRDIAIETSIVVH